MKVESIMAPSDVRKIGYLIAKPPDVNENDVAIAYSNNPLVTIHGHGFAPQFGPNTPNSVTFVSGGATYRLTSRNTIVVQQVCFVCVV